VLRESQHLCFFSLLINPSNNSADLFALMEPYTYHLHLHPSHLTPASNHSRTSSSSSSSSTPYSTTRPPSPYTPHILTLLVVSFPFLAFIISFPSFPIRGVCLIGGLLPFFLTHPWTRTVGVFVLQALIIQGLPVAWKRIEELTWKAQSFYRDFTLKLWLMKTRREEEENGEGYSSSIGENISGVNPIISFKTFLQQLIDDDRLSDSCWNSEMREVELWENERFGGRFFFPVHQIPFNQFSQAQIPLLILHFRPFRAPPSQLPPPFLRFQSLSRLPRLRCRLLLKKAGVSRI
jgi:hypothetical protein